MDARTIKEIARSAAKDIIEDRYDRLWFEKQINKISLWDDVRRKCDRYVEREIPSVVKNHINIYMNNQLNKDIRRELHVVFPEFVANDTLIRNHLQEHITNISNLIDRKKEGILAELNTSAKITANKMAKTDQFGMIYESISSHANDIINKQANTVKESLILNINEEVKLMKKEREDALINLKDVNNKLKQALHEQDKFKYLAICGFATGLLSMGGVIAMNILSKK